MICKREHCRLRKSIGVLKILYLKILQLSNSMVPSTTFLTPLEAKHGIFVVDHYTEQISKNKFMNSKI